MTDLEAMLSLWGYWATMGFTLLPYVAALGIIAACVALVIATMRNAKVYEESTARSAEINKQVIGLLIEIRDRLPKS